MKICGTEYQIGNIKLKHFSSRTEMGNAAALNAAKTIRQILLIKPSAHVIFAAAPSQNEFLEALSQLSIEWNRVHAFHLDEYLGLKIDSTQSFGHYLKSHLFEKVKCQKIHLIDGKAKEPEEECNRYAHLMTQFPPDLACIGIGENNHIAFNDPPARFKEEKTAKIVSLDSACRQQQVNDGCFDDLQKVPAKAITLTIPAIFNCPSIIATVPGIRKAKAIYQTLYGPYSEQFPSSVLQKHTNTRLFLDQDSSSLL